jgi:hypothetical protein
MQPDDRFTQPDDAIMQPDDAVIQPDDRFTHQATRADRLTIPSNCRTTR